MLPACDSRAIWLGRSCTQRVAAVKLKSVSTADTSQIHAVLIRCDRHTLRRRKIRQHCHNTVLPAINTVGSIPVLTFNYGIHTRR